MIYNACKKYLLTGGAVCLLYASVKAQHPNSHMHIMDSALLIEQTEMDAWRSLIDAVPDSLKRANGMEHKSIGGGMAIHFQKMPVPLFNRVIGLGLTEPLTQEVIDEIRSFYKRNEKYIIHFSSPMKPANADSLLKQNGFYLAGAWERIVRGSEPLDIPGNDDPGIEIRLVNDSLREDWVRFLIDTYGYDLYWWPRAFAAQKGWKHYVALRDHKIIACRSFFSTGRKTVFSGVDAPVPGVMTNRYEPDFAIWKSRQGKK
jgi:hypothetical protein